MNLPFPGAIAVEARIRPGVSAVGRIVVSGRPLQFERQANGAVHITSRDAQSCWFAFYSDRLLRNGKQPYSQAGASYLPFSASAMHARPIEGFGALLIQKTPSCGALDIVAVDDGLTAIVRQVNDGCALRELLHALARRAGVSTTAAEAAPLISAA